MITNPQSGVHTSRIPAAPGHGYGGLRGWFRALRQWVDEAAARARRRARLRRDLLRLHDQLYRDIGTTALDLRREAYKPFWRR